MSPELKIGDRVRLVDMPGELEIIPGECGTVTSVVNVFGNSQYGVKWDNGSTLSLLSDADKWMFEKKRIKENSEQQFNVLYNNIDVFEFFKMRFLYQYLKMVRESSIVNMMEAAPYLWIGRERIEHEFKYKDISNEEAFEKVLDHSNQAQAEMINGVIRYLESKGMEESMDNINRYLKRFATKILQNYINMH